MFRLRVFGSAFRTVFLLSGSMLLFYSGLPRSLSAKAQSAGESCPLQDQAGNIISLPGVCQPSASPTTGSPATPRLISGNRIAQCKALMDFRMPKADDSVKINVQVKTEFRSTGSDPSQTTSTTQIKVTGADGKPATRADVSQSIISFANWVDTEVNRLKGLTFQDPQLQQYRGLLIQFGSQKSQEFRRISKQTTVTPEQMVEQFGNSLLSLGEQPPTWLTALDQYCEPVSKAKK